MARVRVKDNGAKALLARVRKGARQLVRVGVFGDLAAQAHKDGDGATIGEIATAHEFTIAAARGGPRSFLRSTIDENAAPIKAGIKRAAEAVFQGKLPEKQALDQVGLHVEGLIKQKIASGIPPALSPTYLPRKLERYPGATTPLIASGQLRGSVTHEVRAK